MRRQVNGFLGCVMTAVTGALVAVAAEPVVRPAETSAEKAAAALSLRVVRHEPLPSGRGHLLELELKNDGDQAWTFLAYPPEIFDPPLAKDQVRPYIYWETQDGDKWQPFGPVAGSEGTKARSLPPKSSVTMQSPVALQSDYWKWRFGITLWKDGDITGDKATIWSDEVEVRAKAE
jgi:hypothetical protein